eukprot:1147376-Ditylum_brightwellii.AAC.1
MIESGGMPDGSKQQRESSPQGNIHTSSLAAVLLGVASSMFLCAVLLYCGNRRDQYLHDKWNQEQHERERLRDDNSSEKSRIIEIQNYHAIPMRHINRDCGTENGESTASGSKSDSKGSSHSDGGYWVHALMQDLTDYRHSGSSSRHQIPPNILPPLEGEEDRHDDEQRNEMNSNAQRQNDADPNRQTDLRVDEVSISRMSTLTTSIMDGLECYKQIDELLKQTNYPENVTETNLPRRHQGSLGEANEEMKSAAFSPQCLYSTRSHDASDCSSLTAETSGTANLTAAMLRDMDKITNSELTGLLADIASSTRDGTNQNNAATPTNLLLSASKEDAPSLQ